MATFSRFKAALFPLTAAVIVYLPPNNPLQSCCNRPSGAALRPNRLLMRGAAVIDRANLKNGATLIENVVVEPHLWENVIDRAPGH